MLLSYSCQMNLTAKEMEEVERENGDIETWGWEEGFGWVWRSTDHGPAGGGGDHDGNIDGADHDGDGDHD